MVVEKGYQERARARRRRSTSSSRSRAGRGPSRSGFGAGGRGGGGGPFSAGFGAGGGGRGGGNGGLYGLLTSLFASGLGGGGGGMGGGGGGAGVGSPGFTGLSAGGEGRFVPPSVTTHPQFIPPGLSMQDVLQADPEGQPFGAGGMWDIRGLGMTPQTVPFAQPGGTSPGISHMPIESGSNIAAGSLLGPTQPRPDLGGGGRAPRDRNRPGGGGGGRVRTGGRVGGRATPTRSGPQIRPSTGRQGGAPKAGPAPAPPTSTYSGSSPYRRGGKGTAAGGGRKKPKATGTSTLGGIQQY